MNLLKVRERLQATLKKKIQLSLKNPRKAPRAVQFNSFHHTRSTFQANSKGNLCRAAPCHSSLTTHRWIQWLLSAAPKSDC